MHIGSLIRLNDWSSRRYLITVLSVQLSVWAMIGWSNLGISIPLLRPGLVFLYLAYLPGAVILRALRIHNLSSTDTLLYCVGLSLSADMLVGLTANFLLPLLGVVHPMSTYNVALTMGLVVLAICLVGYLRDREFSVSSSASCGWRISPGFTAFVALIIWTIAGTSVFNLTGNSLILMGVLLVIAITVVLVAFGMVNQELYPIAIYSVSLSLLLHTSLITETLWGYDVQHEYYLSSIVLTNGDWTPSIPYNTNGMLSIVILAPEMSILGGIPLEWVFKLLFPILFALVPVAIYRFTSRQTSNRTVAFLSAFFFMSTYVFFIEMVQLARQEIAELFLVLLLLLLFDAKISRLGQSLLLILFSFSLIVSHYGLSYIFMILLAVSWVYSRIRDRKMEVPEREAIRGGYLALYVIMAITWYSYVSSASSLSSALNVISAISQNLFGDLFNAESAQGLAVITTQAASLLHSIPRYLYLLVISLILIGLVDVTIGKRRFRFERSFLALSYVALALLLAGIAVPFFASALNISRLYHISLLFLAPYAVIGGLAVWRYSAPLHLRDNSRREVTAFRAMSVLLSAFILFNSGWIYQVADDHPTSMALNSDIDFPRFNSQEEDGAYWLMNNKDEHIVCADAYRVLLISRYDPVNLGLGADVDDIPEGAYVFLGTMNLASGEALVLEVHGVTRSYDYVSISMLPSSMNVVFDNGGAMVLK